MVEISHILAKHKRLCFLWVMGDKCIGNDSKKFLIFFQERSGFESGIIHFFRGEGGKMVFNPSKLFFHDFFGLS